MLDQAKSVAVAPCERRVVDVAIVLSSLLLAPLWLAAPVSGDDWLFFRGPNHDGESAESAWKAEFPESGPKIAWRNLWRNPRRTGLSVAATVFAVVLVMLAVAMNAGDGTAELLRDTIHVHPTLAELVKQVFDATAP